MNRKSLFEEGTFWVAIISFVCAFFCLFVGVFEAFCRSFRFRKWRV